MRLGTLLLAPYLRRDAVEAYVAGNGRATLAAQERDLPAEARSPQRFTVAADVICRLYPADDCIAN